MREQAPPMEGSDRAAAGPLFRPDPGWLFLVSGAALVGATVMIPALDDLARARFDRDRAYAVERYRTQRLENYAAYLDAVRREDPTLMRSLAATQLNVSPADRLVMIDAAEGGLPEAGVFAALEPELEHPAMTPRPDSTLQRWATDDSKRAWLLAGGALAMLIGLMPASRCRAG